MVESTVRVIYGDTDQMGVVYYANYFRYFELGRNEYFRAKGGSYRDFEATGAFLPVVDAHCQYRASARYDDVLRIQTSLKQVRRASVAFAYQIVRDSDSHVLATGTTVHACVGREGKPTRIPEPLIKLIQT